MMSQWRSLVLAFLLMFPFAVYIAVGTWALWENGWLTWLWLPIPLCWGIAFLLLRWWKKYYAAPRTDIEIPLHWTPRDQAAWKLVEDRTKTLANVPPQELTKIQFYVDTAVSLGRDIARVYHPKAPDPISQRTIPEILAALELVFEDLSEMVDQYVPASHLLTVRHYRQLSKIPQWTDTFNKFYWPISAVIAPTTVLARYAASKFVVTPVTKDIQTNILAWFTMTFIQRVGYYAIELNSGRLAGGSKKFRESMRKLEAQAKKEGEKARPKVPPPAEKESAGEPTLVTIALVGQTKAGKSSLANAILGDQKAKTDILPATTEVTRYRVGWEKTNDHLVLLDTVGFATEGATEKQLKETRQALKEADLVLFVMNVNSPAREPDREMLETLAHWFETRKELKPVPVLGVLTHIDLLSPAMEWSPPYDWQAGGRPKEISIREAVAYNRELFGGTLAGVVPVCADVDRDRVYGLEEFLLPAMTALLDDARASSVLRSLHHELSRDRAQRVVKQLINAGKTLVEAGLPSLEQWLKRGKR